MKKPKKNKCPHPWNDVRQMSGVHKAWEGECMRCGKNVRLVGVPFDEPHLGSQAKDEK